MCAGAKNWIKRGERFINDRYDNPLPIEVKNEKIEKWTKRRVGNFEVSISLEEAGKNLLRGCKEKIKIQKFLCGGYLGHHIHILFCIWIKTENNVSY